jgi:hypothetical protein
MLRFSSWQEKEISVFTKCPNWLWGLPSLLFSGYWGPFPRVIKWLGYKAFHLLPSTLTLTLWRRATHIWVVPHS